MLPWIRRVILRRPSPPDDERAIKEKQLDVAALEVRTQTAQVREIRRQAELAELRLRR